MEKEATGLDIINIIDQVQHGQIEAFRSVVTRYQGPLFLYSRHLLGNQTEAEDAVQEIFLKAYRHLHRYRPEFPFAAWLYKIAYNHCLNVIRRRSLWKRFLHTHPRHDSTALLPQDESHLDAWLAALLPAERNIVVLRALEERPFDEIAAIMNCPSATARKRYERARKKLKQQFINQGEVVFHE